MGMLTALIVVPASVGGPLLQGAPVSLDPLWIIGALIAFGGTVWGLVVSGIIRVGKAVDEQVGALRQQNTEDKAECDRRVQEANDYWSKRYAEMLAAKDGVIADQREQTKYWQAQATQPMEIVKSLAGVVEGLKAAVERGLPK